MRYGTLDGMRRGGWGAGWLFTLRLLFALAVVTFPTAARAAPGDLDPTFGNGGVVITTFPNGHDLLSEIAIQPDGKIVAAGYARKNETSFDFTVTRYAPDGSLDTSFAGDGIVMTPVSEGRGEDYAFALALQPDGKIVVAGSAYDFDSLSNDFALVRYNPDGTLDPSFDGDGKVITAPGGSTANDFIQAVVLQPDGKIVAAGFTIDFATGTHIALVRYNADGTLDPTFDGDGRTITPVGRIDMALALTLQPDGKILAAGFAGTGATSGADFALVRYNSDGTLDTAFGGDGKVTTPIGPGVGEDYAQAVVVQPDGKIIAVGVADMGQSSTRFDYAAVRYAPDGSLDTTFGGGGIVVTPISPGPAPEAAYAVALQPDGRIVVAGHSYSGAATSADVAVVRYHPDGTLDTSFGGDGIAVTPVGTGASIDFVQAMALQPDGKIVAAGYTDMGIEHGADFVLVRFSPDGSLDPSLDGDGKLTTPIGSGGGLGQTALLQPDDKVVVAGSSAIIYARMGFGLARLHPDGSLDSSFSEDGWLVTTVGDSPIPNFDVLDDAILQPDGKIVAAGSAIMLTTGGDYALVRYTSDGNLDPTFGEDGKVTTSFGPGATGEQVVAIALQPDGNIVAAGPIELEGTGTDFALARYHSDGSLDTSFDGDGKVTTPVSSGYDPLTAMLVQPDGKIIAAGWTRTDLGGDDFLLVRYNPDGSLDLSFDGDGLVTTHIGSEGHADGAYALALQPDGKIIAAGFASLQTTSYDFALVRYHPDGSLDTSFDGDGKVTTAMADGDILDSAWAIALQADGKIIAAGKTETVSPTGTDFALARYNPDGTLDSSFGSGGKLITPVSQGSSADAANHVLVQTDGRILVTGSSNGAFAVVRYEGDQAIQALPASPQMLKQEGSDRLTDTERPLLPPALTDLMLPLATAEGSELIRVPVARINQATLDSILREIPTPHAGQAGPNLQFLPLLPD